MVREIQNYKKLEDGENFPKLLKEGTSPQNDMIFLVTNLLGPSLSSLFSFCDGKFSLKTSLMIFYQMLERLEFMHGRNYIHRDIKPDNMMMGLAAKSDTLFFVDFGLSCSILDPRTGKHIAKASGKSLIGTCRYVSVNSHKGYELSRRDDLITVGYVIINLLKGSLPW